MAKFFNAGQVCTSPSRFIVHESLYDAFVTELVRAAETVVMGDGLAPGTPLPPERELMQQYAVGRSSVREALRMLESRGLIESRGNGAFLVSAPRSPFAAGLGQLLADGQTDLRPALQRCLDAAPVGKPIVVYFCSGTWRLGGPFQVDRPATEFRGEGPSTTIRCGSQGPGFVILNRDPVDTGVYRPDEGELRVDGDEIVLAARFDAVYGVIDQRDFSAFRLVTEIAQRGVERGLAEIALDVDRGEARLAQRLFALLAQRQKDFVGLHRVHQHPAGRAADLLSHAVGPLSVTQPQSGFDVGQQLRRDVARFGQQMT